MFNLSTKTTMESINVIFDDLADLAGMKIEDDVDDLLETSVPLVNTYVVADVATPGTTYRSTELEVDELISTDDDVNNV